MGQMTQIDPLPSPGHMRSLKLQLRSHVPCTIVLQMVTVMFAPTIYSVLICWCVKATIVDPPTGGFNG